MKIYFHRYRFIPPLKCPVLLGFLSAKIAKSELFCLPFFYSEDNKMIDFS